MICAFALYRLLAEFLWYVRTCTMYVRVTLIPCFVPLFKSFWHFFFFGFLTILSSLCSIKLLISLLLAGIVLCTWMAGWKPFILSHEAICCIDPPLLYVDALGANPILVHVYIPALIYSLLMWCLRGGGTYVPPSRCKLYICRQAEVLCTYVRTYIVGTRCISRFCLVFFSCDHRLINALPIHPQPISSCYHIQLRCRGFK